MVHLHEVRDTDSHYVIDPITRAIANANSAKNTLMQGDHNSEIYTFEIPRYVEGHDMTLCNAIRIHFNDISADKANQSRDFYPVEDMHLDEVQTGTLVFSWLVSGNATMYAGLLSFRIQFLCINDSGVVTYKWHTDVFKGITISDGFDNSETAIEEYSDVIAKWEAELFGAGDSVIENIQNAAGEQIASIEEARSAAVSAVEAKGAETLETIPDDYAELYGMAYDAVRTRANAIVENVEGDAIAANDCSGDYLRGLRVFGKSEQIKTNGYQLFNACGQQNNAFGTAVVTDKGRKISVAGTYYVSFPIALTAGETYYVDFRHSTNGGNYGIRFEYVDNNISETLTNPFEFVPEKDVISIYLYSSTGEEKTVVYEDVQICKGNTALPWEEYSGGVASPSPEYPQEINSVENAAVTISGNGVADQTMVIPRTLHGIPVSNGGNYTDANGQQWICDEVDLARGVYVQRIGQMALADDRIYYYNADTDGKEFFYTAENNNVAAWETRMYCSHFPAIGGSVGMESDYWTQFSGSGGIRFRHKDLTSLTELSAWLQNNPVRVCYVLADPIETALTGEEIFNFSQLHSNYPNTTILNDAGAWIEVAYNADTELYFNNSRGASDEQVQKSVDAWLTANLAVAEEVSF